MRQPKFIMIHHSLTKDSGTVSWPAIERYHVETQGWAMIGYHAGVELVADPKTFGPYAYQALIGRPAWRAAAACPQGDMNALALHVCCVGDFDLLPPDPGMITCLINRVLLPWMLEYGIEPDHIVGHHDYNAAKTCPGRAFDLAALRRRVR